MMRGAPIRDEGLVLRTIRLGDSSKIVSVLSREHGRVKLVARGSRKINSRLGSLLEAGNELELLYYHHPDRDLWTLADASLRRGVLTGAGSLDKLSHLFAALELAERLLPQRECLLDIFELYEGFMDKWHAEGASSMSALFFQLEFSLLHLMGLGLGAVDCSHCEEELLAHGRALYRVSEGVILCPECADGSGRWLTEDTLAALQNLGSVYGESESPALEKSQRRTVGRLLHEHMSFHMPSYRIPKSLYWLAESS